MEGCAHKDDIPAPACVLHYGPSHPAPLFSLAAPGHLERAHPCPAVMTNVKKISVLSPSKSPVNPPPPSSSLSNLVCSERLMKDEVSSLAPACLCSHCARRDAGRVNCGATCLCGRRRRRRRGVRVSTVTSAVVTSTSCLRV